MGKAAFHVVLSLLLVAPTLVGAQDPNSNNQVLQYQALLPEVGVGNVMKFKDAVCAAGAVCALPVPGAQGDVWFTHDVNVLALPPGPANAVFAAPDVQDIFHSSAFIRTAPGPNLGNTLVVNNPGLMGLLPGDNLDAIHHELRDLGLSYDEFPAYVFSVDAGAIGRAGTAVRAQVPNNAADLYESNGFGYNVNDVNENQIGLAPGLRVDLDGVFLTPSAVIDPSLWVYFSLTPGSPTLAAIGAGPGDILAAQLGGSPVVSIKGGRLGLQDGDDIDGLIMFQGEDVNSDGDFDDAGDVFPYVVFSVSNQSFGLAGTNLNNESLADPPVGGDIYSSIGYSQNARIIDDGQWGLGRDDRDKVDALDLPSMAYPPGHAMGTPFTGGFTTPGGPGTPGGPAIPPPGGTGGPPNCTPLASIRFGLCVQSFSNQTCDIEVRVFLSCNTPGMPNTLSTGKITVPCDNGDGNGVRKAVQMLTDALRNLTIPNMPPSPDGGKPVFAPGAGGGAGIGAFPPGGPPTHVNSQLDVNGALVDCKVTGFATILCGCDCYTQNVRAMAWEIERKELIEWSEPATLDIGLGSDLVPGVYMMKFEQDEVAHFIDTPEGSPEKVADVLMHYFQGEGYKVEPREDGLGLRFLADPFERPVVEIWGAGFIEGGTGDHSLTFHALMEKPNFIRADANSDTAIDLSDAIFILNFFFTGGDAPLCEDAADANDDGVLDISDAVKIMGVSFLGETLPIGTRFGEFQSDPTADSLGCQGQSPR